MKSISVTLILLTTFIFHANSLAAKPAKDIKGSKDHPLVSRYPGSIIHSYNSTDYDEYKFPTGPLVNNKLPVETVEGKYTTILYTLPKTLSTLQVLRNYEKAFKKAGLKTQFSCNQSSCGSYMPKQFMFAQGEDHASKMRYNGVDVYNATKKSDYRFWAGVLDRNGNKTYITFMVHKKSSTVRAFLDVVEIKEMETDLVTLNLDSLSTEGKVVLSGIFFDHDKDVLKEGSSASMEVIAKYLQANPKVRAFVVGHSDNKGGYEHNMDLSTRRASSVTNALFKDYKIPKNQLTPIGIGPVSPAVSNASEDGRKQNRRVEMVLQ